jgi:hypothetical protein
MRSFRDQPRFLEGVLVYDTMMPALFINNFIMNKVVPEAWRFQMLVFTLHLYDTRDLWCPTSGLTSSNLKRLCAAQGIASPGRVSAFLGMMRLGGYLVRLGSSSDSRVVQLQPTAAFVTVVEAWNRAIFTILDTVDPSNDFVGHHVAHDRLGWDMRRGGAETLLAGWRPLDPFPEVSHFVSRDGGWVLLTHIVATSLRAHGGKKLEPIAIDLPALGTQFGISRSQLRQLLEAAHAAGLLDAPPRNGSRVLPSSILVCAYLVWLASYLENFRRCTLEALSTLRSGSVPG